MTTEKGYVSLDYDKTTRQVEIRIQDNHFQIVYNILMTPEAFTEMNNGKTTCPCKIVQYNKGKNMKLRI